MAGDAKKSRQPADRDAPRRRGSVLRRVLWIAVAGGFVLGLLGISLFAGFEVAKRELFPYSLLAKVENRIERMVRGRGQTAHLESRTYPSAFVNLVSDVGVVDTGRKPSADPNSSRFGALDFQLSEAGGGLTSFGPDVLLLAFNGVVYAATSSKDIHATRIVAPDNHRAEYAADAAKPEYAGYDFRPGVLRYNDILFIDTAGLRALIASYIEYHPDRGCYTNTLARLDIAASVASIDDVRAAPGDWAVFFRTEPCLPLKSKYVAIEGTQSGGRIEFEAPSTLYLASGDFHLDGMRSEGPAIAQDPVAQYGKVLAIDIATGASRIVSLGHRNVAGIVRMHDGRIFVAEQGPRGGDELNLIREGVNFGWPKESYGTTYRGSGIPGALGLGRHETFAPPALAWLPSVATSSVEEVHGFSDVWEGDLLVGTLKDRSLHRVRLAGDHGVYDERIEIGSRIRDVHQHTDGRLVLWTDNEELIFLTAKEPTNLGLSFDDFVRKQGMGTEMASRLGAVLDECAVCHSFEVDNHTGAPSLAHVFGNEIASSSFGGYSAGLKAKGGTWTHEAIATFLKDPQAYAPGTAMPRPPIPDDEVRDRLIDFLEHLDQNY